MNANALAAKGSLTPIRDSGLRGVKLTFRCC